MGKRTELRERRARARRRQTIIYGLIIVAAAAFVTAMIAYPNFAPIGEITPITPHPRPMADGRAMGDADAPVLIELYEDFRCSACQAFTLQTEPLLVENYIVPGKARLVFRQFPFLEQAPGGESTQAANASMCADEQGRFWDYHDILFANLRGEIRGAFSNRRLEAFAESLGLEMEAFQACFGDHRYRAEIDAEERAGEDLGVNSTPTIFVNGQKVEEDDPRLVPSYETIAQAIEDALAGGGATP
jgi:protein-disulfide isomerase